MPGILPMKVIKVGSSSQSRIAQACDRCRSKKIRCDGIRPTCTQCANVGFECRTSDKLSRRAFPRGYTESLEERIRALEAEVRDLKDLLDEKDEKIDMLSKIHGNPCRPSRGPSPSSPCAINSPTGDAVTPKESTTSKEDTFRVQASPLLLGVENSDSYYMGPSSGRGFFEALKRRLQEAGKPCADFNTESFLHMQGCAPLVTMQSNIVSRIPPRLFTDRCVNIYFQEWASLFPVLHKPTFLRTYEDWVAEPEKIKSHHKLAQLFLVFGIATLSSENPDFDEAAACEQQWQRSLHLVLMDDTMETLQCLVLALTYCQVRADYKRLQHYKCLAVGLSHRLGLHQSQKRFSFGALTIETRKKLFWALYTLDCFSAATLGLPKLINEEDVHTEYPNDIDDEYVTEKGFQPTLPGESTRISGALALFRASRILAKVLERIYPAATSHELSLQRMSGLEAELDDWSNNLPQHLKLNFKQDKPSTDVTGSRSPLLAIAYYYIRTLIYRPAVGSSLGPKAAPAVISVSQSSKHMIQIVNLLEERTLSFSICLNKADLILSCGMALLYQCLELKQDSKMMLDNEKSVNAAFTMLVRMNATGAYDFKRIASLLVTVDDSPHSLPTPPQRSPEMSGAAPVLQKTPCSKAKQRHSVSKGHSQQYSLGRHSSVSETDLLSQQEKLTRLSSMSRVPTVAENERAHMQRRGSRASLDSGRPIAATIMQRRDQRMSMSQMPSIAHSAGQLHKTSLDYVSMGHDAAQQNATTSPPNHTLDLSPTSPPPAQPFHTSMQTPQKASSASRGLSVPEWEALLGQMDAGQGNVYDAIYGGPQVPLETPVASAVEPTWSVEALDLTTFNLGEFGGPHSTSLSEESLSSASGGDDISPLDFRDFSVGHGGMMTGDQFVIDALARDGNFSL